MCAHIYTERDTHLYTVCIRTHTNIHTQQHRVSSFFLIYAERFYYSRDAEQFNYNQTFAIIFFGDKLFLRTVHIVHTHTNTHYVCPKCERNFQHWSIMLCSIKCIILFMQNICLCASGCVCALVYPIHILCICAFLFVSTESKCGTQIINSKIPEFNDDFMEFGLISLKIFC